MQEQIKKSNWIAQIHPYVRVYCAMVLIIAAAAVPHPTQLLMIGLPIIALAVASSLSWRRWIVGLFAVISLIAGLMVLSILSGMSIASAEFDRMGMFIVKCLLVFVCSSALFQTTGHVNVCRALEYIRVPALFTAVAGQIFRWFEIVHHEALRMNTARVLRGGDRKSRIAQLGDIAVLIASLMVRSFSRAERVATAMECRGFDGRLPHSIMLAPHAAAYAPLAITLVYVLMSVVAI
ncbi:energy-coupling factor transporter transmembrane protein EcfT [bacterium]|nr:energy-coupling factor transporter transmembrane protein EcfT [bacterium]